jgi:hypothetical protein
MKQIIYLSIILFSVFVSCEEAYDIGLDYANTNRLVVEGSITNEHKIHSVTLSRTGEFLSNERTNRVLNASVQITDGDTIINLYDNDNDGSYDTDRELAGKINHIYTLNITLENGEQYSAFDTLRPIVPLDSISYEYKKSGIPFSDDYVYNVNIYVQEPPEPNQYYQWELYFDGVHQTDTINTKRFESDELVNGTYFQSWTVFEIEDYRIENEETEVTLQMLSISKEKIEFYYAILLETDYSGSMFSGPPANVPSNISNGAIGHFSASAVTEKTMTIIKAGSKKSVKNINIIEDD